MITKEDITKDIIALKEKLGKIPTRAEYTKYGTYSYQTCSKRFGSWNKTLLEVFGEVNSRPNPPRTVICNQCSKEFKRRVHSISDKNFCSVSCANKSKPKRKLTKKCKLCDNLIKSGYTYCKTCWDEKAQMIANRTFGSFKYLRYANRYSQIREHARKISKDLPNVCAHCGYDKHVEVCHKKHIPDHSDDTLIKEINDIDNLIKLCKNCHWESHNGYLDVFSI